MPERADGLIIFNTLTATQFHPPSAKSELLSILFSTIAALIVTHDMSGDLTIVLFPWFARREHEDADNRTTTTKAKYSMR
jgi:hypothetical protein